MRKVATFGLIFLLALCSSLCVSQIAFAEPFASNFEIIYPTENYYQFAENSVTVTNDTTLAIFNPERKQITVFADTTFLLPCNDATSLVLFGDFLFAQNSAGYEQFVLSTKTSIGQATLTDAPSNYKLYANGNALFAINDFGELQSYNANLDAILSQTSTVLLDATLAVKHSIIYALDYSTSINKFVLQSLDCSKTPFDVVTVLEREENYTHLSVDKYICIAYTKDNSTALSIYDLGGKLLLSQNFDFKISEMTATADAISFLNEPTTALYRYKFKTTNNELFLVFDKAISKSENDGFHLDSPADVATSNDTTYIADSTNNRLVVISNANGTPKMSTISVQSPTSLVAFQNGVYVASENKILLLSSGEIVKEYSLSASSKVSSITKTDKLYALSGNTVYVLAESTFKVFKTVPNAKKLSASANGNIVYVLTDSKILAFSEAGEDISTDITFTKDSIADFDIDFVGNLYVITTNGKIAEYNRGLLNYTFSKEITLIHNIFETGLPLSLSIGDDGKLYFSTEQNFVALTKSFNPQTKAGFAPTIKPQITADIEIFTAKITSNTFFLLDLKNYEYVEAVTAGTIVVCFRNLSADDDFVYLIHGTKLGYISLSNLQEVAQDKPKNLDVKTLHPTAKIYNYPLNQPLTPYQTVPKGTELEILGDVAQFSNSLKWYKVKYNINKVGYIFVADVTDSNDAVLTSGNPVYAKARASRIGEKVSIFALPNDSSTVLDSVTDGTELQVLDDSTYEDYIKVKCGSVVGYVKSNEVKFGGLTHAQVIALVLVCVTAVVAVTISFITYRIKKQNEV